MPSSPFDYDFHHTFDDINAVLERWRVKDEQEYSPTFSVRCQIAAKCLKPSLGQLSSNDPALRQAFYAAFDLSSEEYRKTHPEWFKDEDDKDEWLEDEDEGQSPDRNNEDLEDLSAELQKIKVDIGVLVQVVTVLLRSQGISVLWFLASALAGSFFGSLIW